jgi:hypothetical protein
MSEINRVLVDRAQGFTSTNTATATRSTNVAIVNHPETDCTISGGVSPSTASTSTVTGGDGYHNNMMPYLALTYLIYSPVTVHEPGMVYYNGFYITGPNGGYFTGKGV